MAPRGLQVIGVTRRLGSVVPKEGPAVKTPDLAQELNELERYHADFALAFPVLVGATDATNVSYGEMGVPMTVIVDTRGVIRHIAQGFRAEHDAELVERLLAEAASPRANPGPGEQR
jgi:hypothetical protein